MMGREVRRVPMDFDFPIGESYADANYEKHRESCDKEDHDECDYSWHDKVPEGEGWQLWQTVSDGPVSPVFATADELIDWMCQPVIGEKREQYRRWGERDPSYPSMPWDQGWRRSVAEPFVKRFGWAPSMVMIDGRVMDGATAFAEEETRNSKATP